MTAPPPMMSPEAYIDTLLAMGGLRQDELPLICPREILEETSPPEDADDSNTDENHVTIRRRPPAQPGEGEQQ